MKKEKSDLGLLVDCDIEEFKKEIEEYNRGYLITLCSLLKSTYYDMSTRMKLISSDKKIDMEEKTKVLSDIFKVLFKLEEKILYLNFRIGKLEIRDFDSN